MISTSATVIGFINKPGPLMLSVVGAIFLLEALIMVLLRSLPRLTYYQEAFLDASLLSTLVFPLLYLLVLKPLRIHVELRRKAEAEKDALILELQAALDEVKTLRGFIPICTSCKKIRDDKGSWQQLELYISAHSDAVFSHGVCPDCAEKIYRNFKDKK